MSTFQVQTPKPVVKCVCLDVTFVKMKAMGFTSLEQLRQELAVSSKCGTCGPYIQKMLDTGETEFEVIN